MKRQSRTAPHLPKPVLLGLCSFLFLSIACSQGGAPQSEEPPSELQALVGSRGSSGEAELGRLGYEHRGTRKTDDSSITYWLGLDNSCIEVTTTDGRYAAITPVGANACEDTTGVVRASGDPDMMRTVCGVIVDNQPHRYLCEVAEDRQGTTRLVMPDTTLELMWMPGGKVSVKQDNLAPVQATYSTSEGETDIVVDHRTFFYISNPQAAALEVKDFKP